MRCRFVVVFCGYYGLIGFDFGGGVYFFVVVLFFGYVFGYVFIVLVWVGWFLVRLVYGYRYVAGVFHMVGGVQYG